MRSFLALNLPDSVRECLSDIQSKVKTISNGSGTWSSSENMHLSFAFLGEITNNQADILMRLLSQKTSRQKSFKLTLGHIGFFQDERSATLWCSVNPSNDLKSLVSTIYGTVIDAGIRFDRKPFKAHITLGRKVNLQNVRLSSIEVPQLEIPVDGITLYKSVLTSDGPIYTELGCVPLID